MSDAAREFGNGAVKSEASAREEKILAFWKTHTIFEKTLQKESPKGDFIFYEGPPTANGRPGVHHLESRSFKDAVPRYRTMRGYRVPRRAGWDTHGLPVELEVEKKLGFTGKKDIEDYGIAAFNKKCRESVLTYVNEWQQFTDRIGYWVNQEKAYFTYDASFMESVWSVLKNVADDERLYKDYKVLPWCTRCGTALSSHELAQGYEEVKDLSITAKFELTDQPGTYFLAWTTTPWTLPGNVGLAVGSDIDYVKVQTADGIYILAEKLVAKVLKETPYSTLETIQGHELVGQSYIPLYPYAQAVASKAEQAKFEKAFQVYAADFVTTTDGTGIVHTAVMYGADDFELGTRVGLPKVHLVAPDGHFVSGTGFLEGRWVKDHELAVDILKDLQTRGLFFTKENYSHTYPFCWRCKTPLIYYARDSWYIRMTDLRDELLAANSMVHWEPEHIRDGRMGEWLSGVKDWAISRERYWGTPLPVWQSADGEERVVIGSVEELKAQTKKSGNNYFVMRHGEAEHNVQNQMDGTDEKKWPLTETGRGEVDAVAKDIKEKKVTRIFASPFARTRESAERIADMLGIGQGQIVYDDRLRELGLGTFTGKPYEEFLAYEEANMPAYADALPEGESYLQAKKRFGEFLYELERTYTNETILIVSHGIALETLAAVVEGADAVRSKEIIETLDPPTAQVMGLSFVPLPHNEDYELDLHRPYIDDVVLLSDSGKELHRVKEVTDVWFDSGAMPYAQDHYPFENKEWIEGQGFPADFISEAIDQTRGWFYTLLAIGVLQKRGSPYKNVICLGHLLDSQGKKMSKSKGNVVNPWDAIEQWGVDTLRFWMYSVNQPGDSKNFDEKTVKEAARVLSWFENSAKFYELFAGSESKDAYATEAIDDWMLSRLQETIGKMTESMDAYRLYDAARSLAALFEDLSQWYVRRIRDRARDNDAAALGTLQTVLETGARLLAPFSPFLAEEAYQIVRTNESPESVHLAAWPESGKVDSSVIEDMARVRAYASEALQLRQKAGMKVRQPLASLTIPYTLPQSLLQVLRDEVNVKEILIGDTMKLDTELSDELIAEGDERAFQRAVAEARKTEGLAPKDTITIERGENGVYSAELSTGTIKFSLIRNAS